MIKQRSLILIKPDGIQRGLIGKILKRFEQAGLTIVGFKFVWATEKQIADHYPSTDKWFTTVGQRTLTNYQKKGLDATGVFGTADAITIGKTVKQWLIKYLQQSPVLIFVLESYGAVETIRKICGNTIPFLAVPGTVRSDFAHDTIDLANEQNRPLRNVIHASETVEDADKEIKIWFNAEELFSYKRADEEIMFSK